LKSHRSGAEKKCAEWTDTFCKLSINRESFILNHSNRYTIVDRGVKIEKKARQHSVYQGL